MRNLTLERRAVPAVFVMALAAATAPADGWQSQPGVETELQDASPHQAAAGPTVEIETPGQLDVIVDNIAKVSEVATPDVVATSHPIPMQNVFRADEVRTGLDRETAFCQRGAETNGKAGLARGLVRGGDEQARCRHVMP